MTIRGWRAQTNENREVVAGTFAGVINAKSDLWFFGQDREWTELATIGTAPAARSFFGFTAEPSSDTSFLLFGGFSVKRLPELADTWKLTLASSGNTYTGSWTLIQPTGPSPSGRVGHGLISTHDGKVHLFGGGTFQWNEIDSKAQTLLLRAVRPNADAHWVFDPSADAWAEVVSASTVPMPRCFAGLASGKGSRANSLYLFGGIDSSGNPLNDLWEYRLSTFSWRSISSFLTGRPPSPRYGLGLVSDDQVRDASRALRLVSFWQL